MSVFRVCLLVVALGVVAAPVSAQTERMRGPFSGLFGGGRPAANSQSLNLRASLFAVQQNVRLPKDFDLTLLDPRFQTSSRFAGVSSSLDYQFSRRSDKSSFSVGATGFVADYSLFPKDPQYGVNTSSGAGFSTKLTRKITLTSSALGSYGTQYSFAPFGGGGDRKSVV